MTGSVTDPLLSSDDLDAYQLPDTDWFLGAAGEVIRNQCRWHIFPSVVVTGLVCPIRSHGKIMLPSRLVTSVEAVVVNGTTVDPAQYVVHQAGFITLLRPQQWSGYTQDDWGVLASDWATIDFTHGYATVPSVVSGVGMELVTRAIDERAMPSNYTSASAGPFHITLAESGMVLDNDQIRRLGPFQVIDF